MAVRNSETFSYYFLSWVILQDPYQYHFTSITSMLDSFFVGMWHGNHKSINPWKATIVRCEVKLCKRYIISLWTHWNYISFAQTIEVVPSTEPATCYVWSLSLITTDKDAMPQCVITIFLAVMSVSFMGTFRCVSDGSVPIPSQVLKLQCRQLLGD